MKILHINRFIAGMIIISNVSCGQFLGNLRPNNEEQADANSPKKPEPELTVDRHERAKIDGISTAGASDLVPEKKWLYKKGQRATRDDFIDESQDEGSLWASSGQTNYYFTKNKVKNPGDLITVTIEADLYREICLEVRDSLSMKEKEQEIATSQEQLRRKLAHPLENDSISTSSAAPDKAPVGPNPAPSVSPSPSVTSNIGPRSPEEIERQVARISITDINIQPSLELKAGDTLMGEIVERSPNGNFKIRAMKRILYKKGTPQLVSLIGVVKSVDINEDTDVVNSGKLYDYHVEVAH